MGTTHVLFVTDMSGSMSPYTDDVIGGYNGYLDNLTGDGGGYQISTLLFDDKLTWLCTDTPLDAAPRLNRVVYQPVHMTALFDAIGNTIARFDSRYPTLPPDDQAIVIIQTDGKNNSSRAYTLESVTALMNAKRAAGWKFLYLGAGPEAWTQGVTLGLNNLELLRTEHTGAGTSRSYDAAAAYTVTAAAGASQEQSTAAAWLMLAQDDTQ